MDPTDHKRLIRPATGGDAAACASIYAPFVSDSVVSFEIEPPTSEVFEERIATAQSTHAWLVLEEEDEVKGFAYGGRFAPRAAYQWSCEVSVYVDSGSRRTGAGRQLYEALFPKLAERGFRTAVAGMTVPNPESELFHEVMGFESVGTYRRIGFKNGAWRDVRWMQLALTDDAGPPGGLA